MNSRLAGLPSWWWLLCWLGLAGLGALFAAPIEAQEAPVTPPASAPVAGCAADLRLTLMTPLDFGDVRIPPGRRGYVYLDANGAVSHSPWVLLRRDPAPGELQLCGRADQRLAIIVNHPEPEMAASGGTPVARRLQDIALKGRGIHLQRVAPDRWEGRLGPEGRARVRLGATLYLESGGRHGAASASISLEVVPL